MSKTIIYGDLHGCLDEFKLLRAKINLSKEDKEIIIGDILDRGPSSNKLLKYIQENNILSILGNHEYKYIRYKKHYDTFIKTGKKIPMKLDNDKLKIFNNISEDEWTYLLSLPFYMKIDNLTLVHAGITNKIVLDSAEKRDLEKILWIRTLDKNQKTLSLSDDNPTAKFWSEYYDGNQGIIVYGHQPFDNIKIDKYSIGIDTGCVFGNKLSAIIINDTKKPMNSYEIEDIKAKKEYATKY